ncbi:MAG: hypothetical protein WCP36_07105 [Methanomicrobiales archaeon]
MMKRKGMKKALGYVALMILICVALMATVSATPVSFAKSYQMFSQKGIINQAQMGTTDIIKAGGNRSYSPYDTIAKFHSYTRPKYSRPTFIVPVIYPTIVPVPEQPSGVTLVPGTSNSSLGGIIIRGTEGDWIDVRANFYNPSEILYDGRWHNHVGIVPVYWENMLLPGSYTIRVSNCYCETVTVYPGQTVVIDVTCGGFCVFDCPSC